MNVFSADHTFAICAYQESPYLEECIHSLQNQSVKSNIILCTSTPNSFLSAMSQKYHVPLYINPESKGIAADWNFAYACAATRFVTLAHQDDVYEPDYTETVLNKLGQGRKIQIAFTDYYEIQHGKRVDSRDFLNLRIKKMMLAPLRIHALQGNIWLRRRILSFGDPIGCPSVTYVKENLPEIVFDTYFQSNLDWMTWDKLSKRKGRFVYIPQTLMGHRMYIGSTTMNMIHDSDKRTKEDLEMLRRFWPEPIARVIGKLYSQSQKQRKDLFKDEERQFSED